MTDAIRYIPYDLEVAHQLREETMGCGLIGGPSADQIFQVCLGVARFLSEKNAAYGDSALNPIRCFSKADTVEQIKVRLDDKLSRLMRGEAAGEDVYLDLLGYLVLLQVAELRKTRKEEE